MGGRHLQKHEIAVIRGDGIGVEVVEEGEVVEGEEADSEDSVKDEKTEEE